MKANPFIPIQKANTVIVDGRISGETMEKLRNLDLKVIPTIECRGVSKPIAYHPDIVIHPINHNTLMIAPNVFEYYEEIFKGMGIRLIRGETYLGENYPADIAYNVGRIGNYAIHNLKYTDEKLKFYLDKEGIELIHVEQGYTKCSMAIVHNQSVITADYPIHKKLQDLGFNTLLIRPGFIELKGYPYGFIGGTCGKISKDEILFAGVFINHPDKDKILKFTKKYNKKIVWLTNDKVEDLGTIISLYCQ